MKKRIWVLVAVMCFCLFSAGSALAQHDDAKQPVLMMDDSLSDRFFGYGPMLVADNRILLSGYQHTPDYINWLYIPSSQEYIPVTTADGSEEAWEKLLSGNRVMRRIVDNAREYPERLGQLTIDLHLPPQGTRFYALPYMANSVYLDTQTGTLHPLAIARPGPEGVTNWQHVFHTDTEYLYVQSADGTFQQIVDFPSDQRILRTFALHDGLLVITCGELTTPEYGLGRIGDITAWLLDKELNITQSIPFGRMNTPDNYLFFKRCWESPDHKRIVLTNRLGMPCVIDRRAGTAQILIDHDGKYTTHTAAAGVEVPISYRNAPLGMSKDGKCVLLFAEDRGILCFHPDTFDVHLIMPVDELDPDWLEYGLFYDFTWFGGDYAMAGSQIFRVNLPEHD